jgi:dihydroorotase-like cyclic amidohydrolase
MDLDKEWTVETSRLESKGKYSLLAGNKLTGKIYMTIVRGEIVFREDEGIVGKRGYCQFVRNR